jgi:hypothetical protein
MLSTRKPQPRRGRAGDYSNPNQAQRTNMPSDIRKKIQDDPEHRADYLKEWEQRVNTSKLEAEAKAKAQWIKDHPEEWARMNEPRKQGFFASLVNFGYQLLGKGAEALIKDTIGNIPVIGGKIGDYLGAKAREGLESAGQEVLQGVPMKHGGRVRRARRGYLH